jgi:hypothetical protein
MTGVAEQELTMAELRASWARVYGALPPPRAGREILTLAIEWQRQALDQGGLNRWTREEITRLQENLKEGRDVASGVARQSELSPGVTLIREWNDTTHQVLVLEGGFAWQGKVWKSLSEIAREITGTRWNGPAFFGLRSKKRAAA